jgi:hypothetical protein
MDGKLVGAVYWAAGFTVEKSSADSGLENEGADLGMAGADSEALAVGSDRGTAGIVPSTASDAGKVGCDTAASGTPGTDAPGTRGKENTSLRPAK